jgi:hypothetical protein
MHAAQDSHGYAFPALFLISASPLAGEESRPQVSMHRRQVFDFPRTAQLTIAASAQVDTERRRNMLVRYVENLWKMFTASSRRR